MKTCVSLGLLSLLFFHALGGAVAILCHDGAGRRQGQVVEREESLTGNPSAWHRFSELSERLQEMDQSKAPASPLGKVLKMLNDLAKTYLPVCRIEGESGESMELSCRVVRFPERYRFLSPGVSNRATPPPEMMG